MTLPIVIYILSTISGIFVIGIVLSLMREKSDIHNKTKKPSINTQDIRKKAEQKANQTLFRTYKKARDILVQAELAGIKQIAQSKYDQQKLEKIYQERLDHLIKKSSDHIEKTSTIIEKHFINLFHKTESFVANQIKNNQMRIINQLDLLDQEAEKTIKTQQEAIRQLLKTQLEKELKETKKTIETYKKKKLEQIDNEIVNIVLNTIKQTLGKTLSKKDHAALVYKALEKAKQDGFFI